MPRTWNAVLARCNSTPTLAEPALRFVEMNQSIVDRTINMAHTGKLAEVALDPKDRPRYSKEQLDTYLNRIKLPEQYLKSPVFSDASLALTKEHGLPLVQAMALHHLANVPFENLELHYSAHKTISLQMDDLYKKFAERGIKYGRGGRCMENNGFFGTVLRSLGFEVRNCAGRVSRQISPVEQVRAEQSHSYDGWNHMVNLVLFDGEWWVVDVGMGAWGPNRPYKLEDGIEFESIPPRRGRLQKRAIAESYANGTTVEPPKLWCFDACSNPGTEGGDKWTQLYAFTETEFLPQDYEMMSWFTSTNKKCLFTYLLICTKMLLDDAGEKVVGDITLLNDTVRKNIGKEREVLRECETEQERVQALKEIFGVELTEEEAAGITPELKLQS